jgi:hypothetical protein
VIRQKLAGLAAALLVFSVPTFAAWQFSAEAVPVALVHSDGMTLELYCDSLRFKPADDAGTDQIASKGSLLLGFMQDERTESGAFQAAGENADFSQPDNAAVKIAFRDNQDYEFVLDQLGENAFLRLSTADQDRSYGTFKLRGAGTAIASLRDACQGAGQRSSTPMEAPEGVVYCGGGAIKRQIEYVIEPRTDGEWDARVTVNGKTMKAMTSYSYFGDSVPANFVVALLAEDKGEFLVFSDGQKSWLEFGDYTYRQCN